MIFHYLVIGTVLASILLTVVSPVSAMDRLSTPLPLWSGAVPGARGQENKDVPTLTPYWPAPEVATGAALIICPGGGYTMLDPKEGEGYAHWLNSLGITAFVLKYRLVKDGYQLPAIYQDVARAIRLVRCRADEWKLDPKRIGIIGSSAGGHLAATLLTRFDIGKPDASDPIERVSSRPDLGVLCYAFILFDRTNGPFSHEQFLGPHPTTDQIRLYAPALNVTSETPPCFVWQTVEDKAVPVENALVFADALRKAGVPFDLHLYQKGSHGIGLGSQNTDPVWFHPWTNACVFWLKQQGFIRRKSHPEG